MPQSLTTDEAGRIRVKLTGVVSRAEFEEMFTALKEIEAKSVPIPDRISDISELLNVESGYAMVLPGARMRSVSKFPNNFKNAIIAVTPVQFGLARMFMSLNTNPQIEIAIFKSLDEAELWLSAKPAPVAAVI